ncbi:Histone-lysine N-methyltransferase SETMAR [Ooceraea biroi]|uniref:Histone-lysine N-methyltransferase SETMAR n=1 Tax=Ooceraea biroi TaxID=2015173 RepID=A0A026WA69_OOCBI|nr:Histone-lysine N-methyltransferase SETMAR [Ooceraea biroi]
MENQKEHFPHILFYYFRKGKNAVQARKKLSDVYGEDALKLRQYQNWFTKFRSRDFNVKDAPRSGRPIEIDGDEIKALIDSNRRLTTREIAENLNISKSSVENHLKRPFKMRHGALLHNRDAPSLLAARCSGCCIGIYDASRATIKTGNPTSHERFSLLPAVISAALQDYRLH